MDVLSVVDLCFNGDRLYQTGRTRVKIASLTGFSYSFIFGKSFLLDSGAFGWGETLNWVISGQAIEDSGKVHRNGLYFRERERKKDVWFVRGSSIKPGWIVFREPTIQEQVRYGLRTCKNQICTSEQEVMDVFRLTPIRYQRPIRTLSAEAWRASCAIGFVNGRRIFCFPHMDESAVLLYYDLWLKDMIGFLKNSGSLVLIPTAVNDVTRNLCDDIVAFE